MRSGFDIPTFKNKRDHSSGLVCISKLSCMAGQGDFHPQKQKQATQDEYRVHFQFDQSEATVKAFIPFFPSNE